MSGSKKASPLSEKQDVNLRYFRQNLKEWLKNPAYAYKYLVIHDGEVKGAYDQSGIAFESAVASFPQDEFIIQQVVDEDEIVNFLSGV